jgi:cytochrome c oxidase assembly protein subunit 15
VVHRLALGTATMTVVLIVFGGLVTNTGAALAVPDWPTTFGHPMFLYPWSGMVGGVFYEHGHRLVGSVVGLLTLGLAAALWPRGGRLRALGLLAVVLVVAQGVLGGLRVVLVEDRLAILHGCLAPAFLALLAAIALLASPAGRRAPAPVSPPVRRLALATVGVLYLQIVLGALLTHEGWIAPHLTGAALVFVVAPMATARVRRGGDPVAAPVARALLILLGLQAALGIGAYLARFAPIGTPGEQLTMLALPVAHRAVGALLLALAVVQALRVTAAPSMTPSFRPTDGRVPAPALPAPPVRGGVSRGAVEAPVGER